MNFDVVAPAPVRTQQIQNCAEFKRQAEQFDMGRLRNAGVRTIKMDGKYITVKGVNKNELMFTKEAAMNFFRRLLAK